jgi:membrane-associated protease RseP (regulator of RpoE activity)
MERLGNRWRKGWRTFYDIGAAMGIDLSAFAIYIFIRGLIALVTRSSQATPTSLIIPLPGLTISWDLFPYILVSIAVLLIPHEAAHGIASVLDSVPIKSSGVFMAIFLPGGFVEIDEEDLAKRPNRTKLRVFAAGSFTNVVTAGLVTIIILSFFSQVPAGVLVTSVVAGSGADQAHIPQWSVITAINGTKINSREDLGLVMSRVAPGQTVLVQLSDGRDHLVKTQQDTANNSRAILGIGAETFVPSRFPLLAPVTTYQLSHLLGWIQVITLSVGLVNMLPLFPFDGDRYFATVLDILGVKNTKYARIFASSISLALLLLSLVLSYVVFGTIFLPQR